MTGTRAARAAETESALKEAAKRVFARTGYLRAKITDITSEADRAAGSFYSHFDGKESLLESLLADMLDQGDERAAGPDHSPDFSDPAAVRWHVDAYWQFVRANRPVIIALHQAAMVDEHFARRLREILAPNLHDVAEHLEHVRAAGGELPGDPLVVASALISLISQFAYNWLVEGGEELGRELSDQEAVDTLTGLIVRGISGGGSGPGGTPISVADG
ncbi:TetR/AcrR family transcriptional regulator [Streptacidiphilus sp. N1-12]|uniref:TetR/AcrR family transcriptional regulator n=2 Tax=Streptacidiphilus alkalitolerans TaxID=3342712 RepID=A0ABV6VCC8_9ACTN